jgi:hypothetical protein
MVALSLLAGGFGKLAKSARMTKDVEERCPRRYYEMGKLLYFCSATIHRKLPGVGSGRNANMIAN